jgi:MFS family permease
MGNPALGRAEVESRARASVEVRVALSGAIVHCVELRITVRRKLPTRRITTRSAGALSCKRRGHAGGRVPSSLTGLLTDITPLRESAQFRRLWTGTTLSSVGNALTNFAVPLQVYQITRSPFAVGMIGLAQVAPTLVIGLLGGSVADALDRRTVVLCCGAASAAVSALLAVQGLEDWSSIWLLYLLVALSSAIGAVNLPTRRALIPNLLPADKLAGGLALNRLSSQTMLVAGTALAGLITAAAGGRVGYCYLADAVSFVASLYGVARLPSLPPRSGAAKPGLRAVIEGIGFIRRSQVIAGAFLADLIATVFALPVALFPAINAERFGGNPATLGMFTAAIGVGGLVSSILTGPVGRSRRMGAVMIGCVAIWGAAFTGFALARSLWLVLTLLAIAGAADTFTVLLRGTIVQLVTTEELRGRLTAAEYVVGSGGDSLGSLESGALGSLTSPTISALAGGLMTIGLAALLAVTLPAFSRYQSASGEAQPATLKRADPSAASQR